jgi:heme exporter protein D
MKFRTLPILLLALVAILLLSSCVSKRRALIREQMAREAAEARLDSIATANAGQKSPDETKISHVENKSNPENATTGKIKADSVKNADQHPKLPEVAPAPVEEKKPAAVDTLKNASPATTESMPPPAEAEHGQSLAPRDTLTQTPPQETKPVPDTMRSVTTAPNLEKMPEVNVTRPGKSLEKKTEAQPVQKDNEKQAVVISVRAQVEHVKLLKDNLYELECRLLYVRPPKGTAVTLHNGDLIVLKPQYAYNGKWIINNSKNKGLLSLRDFSAGGFFQGTIISGSDGWVITEVVK